jgi:hypothetical protein
MIDGTAQHSSQTSVYIPTMQGTEDFVCIYILQFQRCSVRTAQISVAIVVNVHTWIYLVTASKLCNFEAAYYIYSLT